MKVLMVPLIVMSAVAGELNLEPSEAQMRGAFEQTLLSQVRNAVAFVAETGGPQAAQAIQQNGTDRFELRTFEKRACARLIGAHAYRCDFIVEISAMNNSSQHALTGRFFAGPNGFAFAQEEPQAPPVSSVL
jgi:hypothetical protein